MEIVIHYIHLLAAIAWVGGMMLFFTSVIPVLKRTLEPDKRVQVMKAIGRRFAIVSWAAIAVLIATGIFKVFDAAQEHHGTPMFWTVLGIKLALVALAILLSIAHDFVYGPRLSRPRVGDDMVRMHKRTLFVARLHFVVILAIVLLGVILLYLHYAAL